ncbi:MAG: L-threonine 3-dehydrogenase [Deltaproteobacteria bacterium]|nr:L-threonine 3-dehydrogenase [Deltaproteobacteria bacterium]
MKSLVKSQEKPGLWMEESLRPVPGPGEVLIRVRKTAICGTDLHIYNWDAWARKTIPVPLIIGHEFSGEVADLGPGVTGIEPGDRVSAEGHITCSVCHNCRSSMRHLCRNTLGIGIHRHGAFAEYMTVPVANIFRIPDDISDDIAAIFDPFGNAVHTALSFSLVGEDVLITGAGPVGLMAATVARRAGARHIVVTDPNPVRLELARKMGATLAANPAQQSLTQLMNTLKMEEGFGVGLEMSGHPVAFRQMISAMNHGGKIAVLGIFPEEVTMDWSEPVFKGLHMKGIYGREIFGTWYKMSALLQSGLDISSVITHRFPVSEFERGFELLREGQASKVILDWSDG